MSVCVGLQLRLCEDTFIAGVGSTRADIEAGITPEVNRPQLQRTCRCVAGRGRTEQGGVGPGRRGQVRAGRTGRGRVWWDGAGCSGVEQLGQGRAVSVGSGRSGHSSGAVWGGVKSSPQGGAGLDVTGWYGVRYSRIHVGSDWGRGKSGWGSKLDRVWAVQGWDGAGVQGIGLVWDWKSRLRWCSWLQGG